MLQHEANFHTGVRASRQITALIEPDARISRIRLLRPDSRQDPRPTVFVLR
jgi:hypothetical protein